LSNILQVCGDGAAGTGIHKEDFRESRDGEEYTSVQSAHTFHMKSLPLCFCGKLAFFNELECNLTLACTTKSIQNKDMSFPQILGEVCMHLRQNVISSSEDWGGRRTAPENLLRFGRRLDCTTWM
jgi:hypothetical protein